MSRDRRGSPYLTSLFRSRRAGRGFPLLLLAFQLMNALSGGNGALPTTNIGVDSFSPLSSTWTTGTSTTTWPPSFGKASPSLEALWQCLLPLHGGRLQRTLQRRQLGHLRRLLGNLLVLKGMLVKCYFGGLCNKNRTCLTSPSEGSIKLVMSCSVV